MVQRLPVAHATGRGCVGLPGLNRILIFSARSVFAANNP